MTINLRVTSNSKRRPQFKKTPSLVLHHNLLEAAFTPSGREREDTRRESQSEHGNEHKRAVGNVGRSSPARWRLYWVINQCVTLLDICQKRSSWEQTMETLQTLPVQLAR